MRCSLRSLRGIKVSKTPLPTPSHFYALFPAPSIPRRASTSSLHAWYLYVLYFPFACCYGDEYQALIDNDTCWCLVPRPPDTNIVAGTWIPKHKFHLIALLPTTTLDRLFVASLDIMASTTTRFLVSLTYKLPSMWYSASQSHRSGHSLARCEECFSLWQSWGDWILQAVIQFSQPIMPWLSLHLIEVSIWPQVDTSHIGICGLPSTYESTTCPRQSLAHQSLYKKIEISCLHVTLLRWYCIDNVLFYSTMTRHGSPRLWVSMIGLGTLHHFLSISITHSTDGLLQS